MPPPPPGYRPKKNGNIGKGKKLLRKKTTDHYFHIFEGALSDPSDCRRHRAGFLKVHEAAVDLCEVGVVQNAAECPQVLDERGENQVFNVSDPQCVCDLWRGKPQLEAQQATPITISQ